MTSSSFSPWKSLFPRGKTSIFSKNSVLSSREAVVSDEAIPFFLKSWHLFAIPLFHFIFQDFLFIIVSKRIGSYPSSSRIYLIVEVVVSPAESFFDTRRNSGQSSKKTRNISWLPKIYLGLEAIRRGHNGDLEILGSSESIFDKRQLPVPPVLIVHEDWRQKSDLPRNLD